MIQTAPNWDLQRHTSTWTGRVPSVSGAAGAAVPSSGQRHRAAPAGTPAPQRPSVSLPTGTSFEGRILAPGSGVCMLFRAPPPVALINDLAVFNVGERQVES